MSRRTDAGWENLADKLPFQPCGDLQNDVLEDIYDNDMLGTGIMLYSRESVETADPIAQIMDAEDWGRWEKSRKRRWGARCTCSACGEEFFAGYVSDSGTSGIVLRQGEDGQIYDGYVDKGDDDAQIFFDDETIVCPRCYQSVVVTRRSELRQGRTLQALQAETLNIDGYLAVLYWMVARYEDTGMTPESVEALKLSMMGKAIAEIKEFNGLPVDRLRELAEADKDGRLVVLPCKVGDTVYLIVTKRARNYTPEFRFVKKSRLTFLNMERILQDFGKEAFLTREEAEKTLEAMK